MPDTADTARAGGCIVMTDLPNLHPVDELADVNAQIAFLQTRKDELRAMIISGACGTIGDTHMAVVKETVSVRVDTKGLRKAWGDTVLASWLRPATSYRVLTQPIADKDSFGE